MRQIFSYGARRPTINEDIMRRHMELTREHFNGLIEIKKQQRVDYRNLSFGRDDEVDDFFLLIEACEGTLADLRTQAADQRMVGQSRRAVSEETTAAAKDTVNDLKRLRAKLSEGIKRLKDTDPLFRRAVGLLDAKSAAQCLAERHAIAARGLMWGSYNAVKASIEQACSGGEMHLRRRGDVNQLVVQIQHGASVEQIFSGKHGQLQIDPVPLTPKQNADGAWIWDGPRHERRHGARTRARIRVESDGRDPVWVEFPVTLHRPLPPNARIMGARLQMWREAGREEFELQLTVDVKAPAQTTTGPAIGIDICWRRQDAIRVAYWYDTDGNHGPVMLDNEIVTTLEHADSLRSIRDRAENEAYAKLVAWLKTPPIALPDWLREETKMIALWKNASRRMAKLLLGHWETKKDASGQDVKDSRGDAVRNKVDGWRQRRFDGDEAMYDTLEAWQRQNKHLGQWEHDERRKALARRREAFRVWAAGVARKYRLVCIEDFDLSTFAPRKPVEEKGEHDDLARKQRVVSAPGELRDVLYNACRSRGTVVTKRPSEFTTIECHVCGQITEWDKAKWLCHRCECGAIWDQDCNAAINLLRDGVDHEKKARKAWRKEMHKKFKGRFQKREEEKLKKLKKAQRQLKRATA